MNITWRIKRKIMGAMIKHSSNPRPASFPYISGDGFRALAQHIYENERELGKPDVSRAFDPKSVQNGQIVFVQGDLLHEFFENVHHAITQPYKLITHNADQNITENELRYIDSKIIHWFAQNVLVEHPKLTPIPIGLENLHYYNFGVPKLFERSSLAMTRKNKILYGFNISSNKKEREQAQTMLQKIPLAENINDWPVQKEYIQKLTSYNFVASPPGNGEDCHRTWEALYVRTVPIVKKSFLTEHFKSLGLPLFVINDWNELLGYNDETLEKKYRELSASSKYQTLQIDYWKKLIQQ